MERTRYVDEDLLIKLFVFKIRFFKLFIGVGELKILHHPTKNTYRLLLRREQVHKCVLNHALNGDIHITPMQSSDKAFCWATNNFADDPNGVAEQLSVRFKNSSIASAFDEAVKKCMSQLKLEPQDD